jgi:hypothetical protein
LRYKGGQYTYGQAIGILVVDSAFPRVPGDMGNATTFDFPVRFRVVKGATPRRVSQEQDPSLLEPFIAAAKELAREGVRAITTTSGFLAMFQREMTAAVGIPLFASSLLQVPLVYRMLQPGQKVGIITANAQKLHGGILEAVGAGDVPVAIAGMEDKHEFTYMRKQMNQMDPDKVKIEVVSVVQRLIAQEPCIGALVLECHNLPPYSKAIQEATRLPVFDIMTLTKWVYSSLVQGDYNGYL